MEDYETGYQALDMYSVDPDEHDETPPTENIVQLPDQNKARWNHIEDLDEFFTRVYQYHQRSGITCMVVQDGLQIIQFMFVVIFSVFLMTCVDYPVLFYDRIYNVSHKVTLQEAIYPLDKCAARMDPIVVVCLLVAFFFWIFRVLKMIYMVFKYLEMHAFYTQALKISLPELQNMTWHEVQRNLQEIQREQQMCIHKDELTQLDIYHRILRFKNYMVSMVNKSLLPLKFTLPFVGDYCFLSTGLKFNLEFLLFWGPWSPFENNWHLKAGYKNFHKRKELAAQLSRRVLVVGLANLLLCPLIFLWQILYSFFRYAEVIKREPALLGSRKWSNYARLYARHFNELDHEFNARLNRAYKPAERYMNTFISPLLVICAKYMSFFAGSILAVLVILTVIDEDFLAVKNIIGVMTVTGLIVTISRSCIPDEHSVWRPELLMKAVLAQLQYMPDSWKGSAHKFYVRNEFASLFQYKALFLVEELLSPIVTPLILCFVIRHKSLEIVDFYRNFTVEVVGVGDVCSFAQLDVRKHGHPQWAAESQTGANQYQQAEDGKTELSLVHFTLTNPEWHPPEACSMFITNLKEQAHREAETMNLMPGENALFNSLQSMSSFGHGYSSMMSSVVQHSLMQRSSWQRSSMTTGGLGSGLRLPPLGPVGTAAGHLTPMVIRGGMKNVEGPLGGSTNGLLASLQHGGAIDSSAAFEASPSMSVASPSSEQTSTRFYDEEELEMMSAEMSLSALYMHEVHRRRLRQAHYENTGDAQARALWQTPETIEEVVEEDASLRPPGRSSGDENQRLLDEGERIVDI